MTSDIPSHHRTLVLESFDAGFSVQQIPTPQPVHGSAIIRIAFAGTVSYSREVYNGQRDYSLPLPLVAGLSAVGRVVALGPDAAALQVGQLVFVDCTIRSRDGDDGTMLSGLNEGYTNGSRKLMRDAWKDGTYAEYARMPLENCIPLPEVRLCRELGYDIKDLLYMHYLLVPFGGLRSINLLPGETIVVSPATGGYGGAAVVVAIAMGARVIAMGRNEEALDRLKSFIHHGSASARIETVKISGDSEHDTASLRAFGVVDAVLDLSPPAAAKSTHLGSAISALRRGGRVSLMGFVTEGWPMWKIVGHDIVLKGKLMYSREDMLLLVKMLEQGLFAPWKDSVLTKAYSLEEWEECLDEAARHTGVGKHVVFEV